MSDKVCMHCGWTTDEHSPTCPRMTTFYNQCTDCGGYWGGHTPLCTVSKPFSPGGEAAQAEQQIDDHIRIEQEESFVSKEALKHLLKQYSDTVHKEPGDREKFANQVAEQVLGQLADAIQEYLRQ